MAKASKEPTAVSSEIDQAAVESRRLNPEKPTDLGEYSGKWKYIPTGEIFGLKVFASDQVRAHRTHHAKNERSFWDGTAEQFRQLFDKA